MSTIQENCKDQASTQRKNRRRTALVMFVIGFLFAGAGFAYIALEIVNGNLLDSILPKSAQEIPVTPDSVQMPEPVQQPVHVEYDLAGEDGDNTKLLEHYLAENNSVVARLYIPDTDMETPVVDTDYYLHRNIYGDFDTAGVPFVDSLSGEFLAPNQNTIIHGHRLQSGRDFGVLKNYTSADYYNEHPSFYIETEDGTTEWHIVAIIPLNIVTDSFDYLGYGDLNNQEKRDVFISTIRKRSVVDCADYEMNSSTAFVTLSTCHYETDQNDGRLIVIGACDVN